MIVKIIPKEGLKVRDPITKKHLNAEGEDLELSAYWIRRELAGEIVIKKDKLVASTKQK